VPHFKGTTFFTDPFPLEVSHVGLTWKEIVPQDYHDFDDLFTKDKFDRLLPHRGKWDHTIDFWLSSKNLMIPGSIYPLNDQQKSKLDEFIEENLSSGRIVPCKSPIVAPFFFVRKKDPQTGMYTNANALRPTQDYRKLNKHTIPDKYPLPLIEDIVNQLGEASWFTALDIRWGYNNIRIQKGDEYKAAFMTQRGTYKPLVMFFGLCNSPATFQRFMDQI
jgi:Reverse transcriptase (RNA-dependent DNA polymerase)